jgi:hypothetical protein|tara:strand:- start:948 stop:1118 length:171 start_codon:yes stop_codon:yes gene_type:complete
MATKRGSGDGGEEEEEEEEAPLPLADAESPPISAASLLLVNIRSGTCVSTSAPLPS